MAKYDFVTAEYAANNLYQTTFPPTGTLAGAPTITKPTDQFYTEPVFVQNAGLHFDGTNQ